MSYFDLFSLIFLTLVIIFLLRVCFPTNEIKSKSLVKSNFDSSDWETGDLVFTSYHNLLGKFMRGWSGSLWSHIGIILKDDRDGSLYVLETADYSDKDPKLKGLIAVPLKTWLSINKKCRIAYMKLHKPQDYKTYKIVQEFYKLQQLQLDTKEISFNKFIKLGFKHKFDDQEFTTKGLENPTCYELIVLILQRSEIAESELSPGSYFASDVLAGKLKLKKGFSFDRPFELTINHKNY